jgi:hypothetical protein
MKTTKNSLSIVFFLLFATIAVRIFEAQQAPVAGTVPVSIIVSVEPKHGKDIPNVYKEDVRVFQGRDRLPVTDWNPCNGEQVGLQLMVLVDEATTSDISLQFGDLKSFMEAQPATTAIGVAYARNGMAQILVQPTRDHAQAGKALRLPVPQEAIASIYLSVTDLIKGWSQTSACREILMVSSGIDYLQGGPQDSYLDEAIEQAQRAAIQVYAIYAGAPGHAAHSFWRLNWGQNNLAKLAEATGGEFYIQGLTPAVSFAPYLSELSEKFKRQYKLTFPAKAGNKPGLERVRVETEVTNAELVAQEQVYIPASK